MEGKPAPEEKKQTRSQKSKTNSSYVGTLDGSYLLGHARKGPSRY